MTHPDIEALDKSEEMSQLRSDPGVLRYLNHLKNSEVTWEMLALALMGAKKQVDSLQFQLDIVNSMLRLATESLTEDDDNIKGKLH
jgi:hypothetical protein